MTADFQSDLVTIDVIDKLPTEATLTKTVEGRLSVTLSKLAATEGNLHLFTRLRRLGLSTNDVSSFVDKQLVHKKVLKSTDFKVKRTAMMSKIVDASAYAKRLRQEKNTLRKRLFMKYRNNKSKGKQIMDNLVQKYRSMKSKEYSKAEKKIKFYGEKNHLNKSLKAVPPETSEFLSGVNLFSSEHPLEPAEPLGPFICHESIKLSNDELMILSRGPKFMIREDLSLEDHKVDVEKMVVKKKFDRCFEDMEDDSPTNPTNSAAVQLPPKQLADQVFGAKNVGDEVKLSKNDKNDKLENDWEENCGSMPYNFRSKTLDLGNLRATSYKYNKDICLPSNESPQFESAHEFRRNELIRVFNRVANDPKFKDSGSESNLSPAELRGLKSLKKRIKEGSLIVADTDKSKRFACLTREQYVQSGLSHTANDIEITQGQVKRIQTVVNDHTWWLQNILSCGKN